MKLKNKKTATDIEAIAEENESFGEPKPVVTISFKGQSVSLLVNELAGNVETEIGLDSARRC